MTVGRSDSAERLLAGAFAASRGDHPLGAAGLHSRGPGLQSWGRARWKEQKHSAEALRHGAHLRPL